LTGAKLGAIVTSALTLMYVAILGQHGVLLLLADNFVAKIFGFLILVLPVFAIFGIIRELRFGLQIEKLGKQLEALGQWPKFNFELRPSGRPTRASADAEFLIYRDLAEQNQGDWKAWFALGLAYDACGDRGRARGAMRKAIKLAAN
jgi:hypothetical protein